MTEIRKKIAALTLAGTMLLSASGCSKNTITRNVDGSNVTFSGDINIDCIDDLYIIELHNTNGEKELFLTRRSFTFKLRSDKEYEMLGTNIEITNDEQYTSSYGTIENIIPFTQFLTIGNNPLKENYSGEEITSILNVVKNKYSEIIANDKVKKLEFKK